MTLRGQVARMGQKRSVHRILVGKTGGNNHLEDLGVDRRRIIERIDLKEIFWEGVVCSIWLRIGTSGGIL
jgi:hypothetical protein